MMGVISVGSFNSPMGVNFVTPRAKFKTASSLTRNLYVLTAMLDFLALLVARLSHYFGDLSNVMAIGAKPSA
jgi:hypothetical protein